MPRNERNSVKPASISPVNLDTEVIDQEPQAPEQPIVKEPESEEPLFIERFNITQRRFLAENFKDALVNANPQGQDYFKRLGPTVQAVMREAVNFTCLYKPIKGTITHEQLDDGSECDFVTIDMEIYQPSTHDKIILTRKFSKSYLDNQ